MTIFFVSVTDLYDKKEVIVFVVDVCKFKMSDKQYGTFVIICLKVMLQFNALLYRYKSTLRV